MLEKILDRKTCAKCQWCCTFDRNDQWETPLIIAENVSVLRQRYPESCYTKLNKDYKLSLSENFKTDDPKEYVCCPFLDRKTGCILSEEEKPFDCKIWPLRIMRKEEQFVLALTPTCPACNSVPKETLEKLAEQELAVVIAEYAEKHPDMILPYRTGYPILLCF